MAASPLFLYIGPETGERNDAAAAFLKNLEKTKSPVDSYTLYASETKVPDVLSMLQNGSLFAAARFVVLRDAEVIKKKEDIEMIKEWADGASKSGAGDAFLFLISDETSVDKKLDNAVPKENKKVFWEMFDDRKEQWLSSFFKKNNFSLDSDAAQLILEMVENNTEALRNECSRFFSCFPAGTRITSDDVDKVLTHNREESPFTLFNAASDPSLQPEQRLESALLILQKIRQSKESSGVQFIAGLTYCFRRLRAWHNLYAEGWPSEFELKTSGFGSKKIQTQYRNAARIWNADETSAVLSVLASADMDIRSTGQMFEETLLVKMLFTVIMRRGAA